MKIYKLEANGKEYFVAANKYKRAVHLLAEELNIKKYITGTIGGKVLLKQNPATRADYLKIDIEAGVVDKNLIPDYFCGDKEDIKPIDPVIKRYIDDLVAEKVEKGLHKAVQEYFEERVPF